MENLIERQNMLISVLDVFDGMRNVPDAKQSYEFVASVVNQLESELNKIQANINDSKKVIEGQKVTLEICRSLQEDIANVTESLQAMPQESTNTGSEDPSQASLTGSDAKVSPTTARRQLWSSPTTEMLSSAESTPIAYLSNLSIRASTPLGRPVSPQSHRVPRPPTSRSQLSTSVQSQQPAPRSRPATANNQPTITSRVPAASQSFASSTTDTPKPRRDLEASISYLTHAEFDKTPGYMRGRLKFEEVNDFVTRYNQALNLKQSLLKNPRAALVSKKQDLVLKWKEVQSPELANQYHLTGEDFQLLLDNKLTKKDLQIVQILRHFKRLKEVRVKKIVYFIALF